MTKDDFGSQGMLEMTRMAKMTRDDWNDCDY